MDNDINRRYSKIAEKYVDGRKAVVDYEMLINEFALMRNKWLGVLKSLDSKGFSLNNIIRSSVAGMNDAAI